MNRNKVQFQKGISLSEFLKDSGTEEQCFHALVRWPWPDRFRCALCHHDKYGQLKNRNLYQCNRCHHQTSVIAGTIFQSTTLSLTTWFQGIDFITQDKKGIAALELHRLLGISYHAAWRMKQKLMQVMLERDDGQPLSGFIELDDAYSGR